MQTVIQSAIPSDLTMQTMDLINQQLNSIEFPDIASFKKCLYEFTTLLAIHYNVVDRDILTKLSTIESNLFLCLQMRDTSECLSQWNSATTEFKSAIDLAKKSI